MQKSIQGRYGFSNKRLEEYYAFLGKKENFNEIERSQFDAIEWALLGNPIFLLCNGA